MDFQFIRQGTVFAVHTAVGAGLADVQVKQLPEREKLFLNSLLRENRAAGACPRCHQIVRTEGHAEDCTWGAAC